MLRSAAQQRVSKHEAQHVSESRPLRSYGRRKARPLSERKDRLLNELLPILRLPLGKPVACSADRTVRAARCRDLARDRLRLGRASLLAGRASSGRRLHRLRAVHQWRGEPARRRSRPRSSPRSASMTATPATCSPGCPNDSIGRIFILFPDPWPKKRHQKRQARCARDDGANCARAEAWRRAQICQRQRRLCRRGSPNHPRRMALSPGRRNAPRIGGSGLRTGRRPATNGRP